MKSAAARNPFLGNGSFPNVVVTALAATTSIAGDIDETWAGLLAGASGIDHLDEPFVDEFDLPVRIGGSLKVPPETLLGRVEMRRLSYVERLATVLGRQVWSNAGSPEVVGDRLGVSIGTGLGGGDALIDAVDKLKAGGYRKVSPLAVPMIMPNGPAAALMASTCSAVERRRLPCGSLRARGTFSCTPSSHTTAPRCAPRSARRSLARCARSRRSAAGERCGASRLRRSIWRRAAAVYTSSTRLPRRCAPPRARARQRRRR